MTALKTLVTCWKEGGRSHRDHRQHRSQDSQHQLSIKAKDNAEQQEALQRLSSDNAKEGSGTTSLGALLKAKLDQNNG